MSNYIKPEDLTTRVNVNKRGIGEHVLVDKRTGKDICPIACTASKKDYLKNGYGRNPLKDAVLIRLNASNDRNGNPRRCYVAINQSGDIVGVWDEGYKGYGAVPEDLQDKAHMAPTFLTTPGEYRDCLKVINS